MTDQVRAHMATRRSMVREAVEAFVSSVDQRSPEQFVKAMNRALNEYIFPQAARALLRSDAIASDAVRMAFLDSWIKDSDPIRSAFTQDVRLLDLLWRLMPSYDGPDLILFRGDGAWHRHRRLYGPAWSSSRDVARDYALYWQQFSMGGGVLLRTEAPAAAIICAPGLIDDRTGESEFMVDRRRLGRVEVVERFSEITPA